MARAQHPDRGGCRCLGSGRTTPTATWTRRYLRAGRGRTSQPPPQGACSSLASRRAPPTVRTLPASGQPGLRQDPTTARRQACYGGTRTSRTEQHHGRSTSSARPFPARPRQTRTWERSERRSRKPSTGPWRRGSPRAPLRAVRPVQDSGDSARAPLRCQRLRAGVAAHQARGHHGRGVVMASPALRVPSCSRRPLARPARRLHGRRRGAVRDRLEALAKAARS